jgi:DNA polymerase III alpha subunit (gram-positive type)
MYLFMDTETGGLSPKYSLLTASFILVDSQFDVLARPLYLEIKHDEYVVTPGALNVNHINLAEHHKTATALPEARAIFSEFVNTAVRVAQKKRLVPAGHNVGFDMQFVRAYLCPTEKFWDDFFTYPIFDTAVIARFMHAAGFIDNTYSLPSLRQKYLPDISGDAHNAEIDNITTIELVRKFLHMTGRMPASNLPGEPTPVVTVP